MQFIYDTNILEHLLNIFKVSIYINSGVLFIALLLACAMALTALVSYSHFNIPKPEPKPFARPTIGNGYVLAPGQPAPPPRPPAVAPGVFLGD